MSCNKCFLKIIDHVFFRQFCPNTHLIAVNWETDKTCSFKVVLTLTDAQLIKGIWLEASDGFFFLLLILLEERSLQFCWTN